MWQLACLGHVVRRNDTARVKKLVLNDCLKMLFWGVKPSYGAASQGLVGWCYVQSR